MSQQELLTETAAILNRLQIDFFLSGSHASSLQGEPRATHGIDLVCRLSAEHLQPLLSAFPPDRFYLSESAVAAAIQTQRMFNLLDLNTGEQVDFWVLTESPFDQSRISQRRTIVRGGISLAVSAPENTTLMKLYWANQAGGSEKQFHDVVRVYELQAGSLDLNYLKLWAKRLDVADTWERVLREAQPFISTIAVRSDSERLSGSVAGTTS